ncbi:MAG: aminodeoxychorismate/anthranilate synthase component II [Pseudomonadota bacterium]
MLLMIDNYDSFTYNLVQYLAALDADVRVFRNDAITAKEAQALQPDYVVISPGPGVPDDAGVSLDVVRAFAGRVPLLGVCLGHQCIAQAFGGRIVHATRVMHGKPSLVHHDGNGLFAGLTSPFEAIRYHSLVVAPDSVPDCLEVSATTRHVDGSVEEIMALRHRDMPVTGVQFHPEAFFTQFGHELLRNFLAMGTAHAA